MSTEVKRQALTALRNALSLCENCDIVIYSEMRQGFGEIYVSLAGLPKFGADDYLEPRHIDQILAKLESA